MKLKLISKVIFRLRVSSFALLILHLKQLLWATEDRSGLLIDLLRPLLRNGHYRIANWPRIVLLFFAVFSTCVLSGCDETSIAHDISQVQANEIVSVLSTNGITAEVTREGTSKGKFQVVVANDNFARAATILTANGLPSPARASFEGLVAPNGFMPASREMEATRLDHALASEIDDLIGAHPSVRRARTVVRLNYLGEIEKVDGIEKLASVAVVAEAAVPVDQLGRLRDELIDTIAQVVPAISRERISVLLEPEPVKPLIVSEAEKKQGELVPFLIWNIPDQDYNGLALTVAGCILAMGIIGGLIGYWLGFYQYSKHTSQVAVNELEVGFAKLASGKVSQREKEL